MEKVFIISLLIACINAYRGSGMAKEQGILRHIASKWACVVYFFLLMAVCVGFKLSALYTLPWIFLFATGTGGLMQAFTTGIIDPNEFSPFDRMVVKIMGKDATTLGAARKWGVIYGSLVGAVFALPCLLVGNLIGLVMLLTGFVIGGLRYVNVPAGWRYIEFGWFGFIYSLLFGLGV